MNEKFFELKKEKQDRMINGALKIFALQGYRHASTDDIVREASVSKGLLFHYFESKQGLYEFVCDYSARFLLLELAPVLRGTERDLFEVLRQVAFARMQVMRGYPYLCLFLDRAMKEELGQGIPDGERRREELLARCREVGERLDSPALPTGVDRAKLCRMLEFTAGELTARHLRAGDFQPQRLYQETVEYLNMVRRLTER